MPNICTEWNNVCCNRSAMSEKRKSTMPLTTNGSITNIKMHLLIGSRPRIRARAHRMVSKVCLNYLTQKIGRMLILDKRYQVFVSSTFSDLEEERQEVMQALLELDCMPAGMELFPMGHPETNKIRESNCLAPSSWESQV